MKDLYKVNPSRKGWLEQWEMETWGELTYLICLACTRENTDVIWWLIVFKYLEWVMRKEDMLYVQGRALAADERKAVSSWHEELLPTALPSQGMGCLALIWPTMGTPVPPELHASQVTSSQGAPERHSCSCRQRTNQMISKSPFHSSLVFVPKWCDHEVLRLIFSHCHVLSLWVMQNKWPYFLPNIVTHEISFCICKVTSFPSFHPASFTNHCASF